MSFAIPKPILFPQELILKLTPVRSCVLLPTNPSSLGISIPFQEISQQPSPSCLFDFYAKSDHQYCLVYLTTLRIIVIPFAEKSFQLSYAFGLPIKQVEKCSIGNPDSSVEILFHAQNSNLGLSYSRLLISSKSRRRTIDIASLISAIRYAHAVGKQLPKILKETGTSKTPSSPYDHDTIPILDTGYDLFYHQLDPKLQLSHGQLIFPEQPIDDIDNSLPSYSESEQAVGAYFKDLGLLNQIVIRDMAYLENIQRLSEWAPPQVFDYYYDQDLSSEFRPFMFISADDSSYGNYYYKFLAENALRYSERNVDDIVQVIYDNLQASQPPEPEQPLVTSSKDSTPQSTPHKLPENSNSTQPTHLLHRLLSSSSLSRNESLHRLMTTSSRGARTSLATNTTIVLGDGDDTEVSRYTNNTSTNPRYNHISTTSSVGNIQDLIACDEDTRGTELEMKNENVDDKHNGLKFSKENPDEQTAITAAAKKLDISHNVDSDDDSNSVDFFTAEGYSRITAFLDDSSVSLNSGILEEDDEVKHLQEAMISSRIHDNEVEYFFSEDEKQLDSQINNSAPPQPIFPQQYLEDYPKSTISSSVRDDLNPIFSHNTTTSLSSPTPSDVNSSFSFDNLSKIRQSSLASNSRNNSSGPMQHRDFLLNNNKFLEDATDQSMNTYLNRDPAQMPSNSPINSPALTNLYWPSAPKGLNFFNKRSEPASPSIPSTFDGSSLNNKNLKPLESDYFKAPEPVVNDDEACEFKNDSSNVSGCVSVTDNQQSASLKNEFSTPQLRSLGSSLNVKSLFEVFSITSDKSDLVSDHTLLGRNLQPKINSNTTATICANNQTPLTSKSKIDIVAPVCDGQELFNMKDVSGDTLPANQKNGMDSMDSTGSAGTNGNDSLEYENQKISPHGLSMTFKSINAQINKFTSNSIKPSISSFTKEISGFTSSKSNNLTIHHNSKGNHMTYLRHKKSSLAVEKTSHSPSPSASHSVSGCGSAVSGSATSGLSPYGLNESSSSSMISSTGTSSVDVCPFYFDPGNPYSDIVNNRVKYHPARQKKRKISNLQNPVINNGEDKINNGASNENGKKSIKQSLSNMNLRNLF
ncbi:hypothetical protein DASC09_037030 [Saccharomycopsis crataegensis]|uniref:Protein kinase domain-containing protein n=1 Tax=Saccharomycopsis crataegensis TaxID=43959 RepID=A0AAV5QNC7_9ASCO|nr:hypothetical protein DASC09_037030 [Saccharomycopsis crataegensis]